MKRWFLKSYPWLFLGLLGLAPHAFAPGPSAGMTEAIVEWVRGRDFPGVFMQQEHEKGRVNEAFFNHYRPTEIPNTVLQNALNSMSPLERAFYNVRNYFYRDPWKSLTLSQKLQFLSEFETRITRERGRDSVWRRKVFLLLRRTSAAPSYLAEHPSFERVDEFQGPHRFSMPEITSSVTRPSTTIAELRNRTEELIRRTGFDGLHYHVFLSLPNSRLQEALPQIQEMLQFVSDYQMIFYLQGGNLQDISRRPWHADRMGAIHQWIQNANPEPQNSPGENADSEKHANIGFRYWGTRDGNTLISFEDRGANRIYYTREDTGTGFRWVENIDHEHNERILAFLEMYASLLVQGRAPRIGSAPRRMDLSQVQQMLHSQSIRRGIPVTELVDLETLARRLGIVGRDGRIPLSLLFPFSYPSESAESPRLQNLMNTLIDVSRAFHSNTPIDRPDLIQQIEGAYATWAREQEPDSESRFRQGLYTSFQSVTRDSPVVLREHPAPSPRKRCLDIFDMMARGAGPI